MIALSTILLICALVCFLLGTFNVPTRINLVSLGLAFVTIAVLLGRGLLLGH